jgi:hypothetical protein
MKLYMCTENMPLYMRSYFPKFFNCLKYVTSFEFRFQTELVSDRFANTTIYKRVHGRNHLVVGTVSQESKLGECASQNRGSSS